MQTKQYKVTISFKDCVLEEENSQILPLERMGCFVQYKGNFIDALMINQPGQKIVKSDTLTFEIDDVQNEEDPKIVLIVKDIQEDDPYIGSVSIPRSIILDGQPEKLYSMWITLFDDQGDDEYDGAMGLDDDEEPRVLVDIRYDEIRVQQPKVEQKKIQEPAIVAEPKQDLKKNASTSSKGYLNPIGNSKDQKRVTSQTQKREPSPPKVAQTPVKQVSQVSQGSQKVQRMTTPTESKPKQVVKPTQQSVASPTRASMPSKLQKIEDITSILEQNPAKRQNIQFLQSLLDQQLGKLCSNLKVMQSDNAEIETETIQRLQLIEKFGNDASQGLQEAIKQNKRLVKDLDDQKVQHTEVMQGQEAQQSDIRNQLSSLESQLKDLRQQLAQQQESHQQVTLQKQEMLENELNSQTISKTDETDNTPQRRGKSQRGGSPTKQNKQNYQNQDIQSKKQKIQSLKQTQTKQVNQLKDLARQVPVLASDFMFEMDQLGTSCSLLIQQNLALKGEIIQLEEDKKFEQLISKLEDEKKSRLEQELKFGQERASQLEQELTQNINQGDQLYDQFRSELSIQNETEDEYSNKLNTLANRTNMFLRSKLNCNKSDFERLRNIGQIQGVLGSGLERKVAEHDSIRLDIISIKKDAHKGLVGIRDVMKCDIGREQHVQRPDLRQVDQMCKLLDEKDKQLFKNLMPAKDKVEKEYLQNQVNNGLAQIMKGDKADIQQHIEFNKNGLAKLEKINEMYNEVSKKQQGQQNEQIRTLKSMDDQIAILNDEKEETLAEIERYKQELEELQKKLAKVKKDIDTEDGVIADLEAQIDAKIDEMSALEAEILMKTQIINDLENQLATMLNRKQPVKLKPQFYIPVKGDIIDEKLAEYINEYGSLVPWKRVSEGNYLYGSKKCNAKYLKHLIIKVGGGSMHIDEFIASYEEIELTKLNYLNPGAPSLPELAQTISRGTRAQNLARGGSPRNSVALGSPKGNARMSQRENSSGNI